MLVHLARPIVELKIDLPLFTRSGDGSNTKNCFPCQSSLGQYSNYTHNPNGYFSCLKDPRYEVTGQYTYLSAEPGFNTVIEFTGPSTITINYSPLSMTSVVFFNGIEVYTITVVAQPGVVNNIPAGTQPGGSVVKIIAKFNV